MIGITCVVDRIFRKSLDTVYNSRICGLTCTLDLLRPECTCAPPVQTCIARCALGGISNARGARGRRVPTSLVPISIVSVVYVCLLLFFTRVTSSDILMDAVNRLYLCIRYRRRDDTGG